MTIHATVHAVTPPGRIAVTLCRQHDSPVPHLAKVAVASACHSSDLATCAAGSTYPFECAGKLCANPVMKHR